MNRHILLVLLVAYSAPVVGDTNRVEAISVIRQRIASLESGATNNIADEVAALKTALDSIVWKPDDAALEGLLLLSRCDLLAKKPQDAWARRRVAEEFLMTATDPNVDVRVSQYRYRLACLVDDYYWSLPDAAKQRKKAILDGRNWSAVVRRSDEFDPLLFDLLKTFGRVASSAGDGDTRADAVRRIERLKSEFK